ncbi:MAG: DUF3465 domain-containing protein [Halioglobus sp.]
MKKLSIALVIALGLAGFVADNLGVLQTPVEGGAGGEAQLNSAFQNQQSDLQIGGSGTVIHILPDDTRGSQHQKFLLKLASGQKLLIAHNIDLAPRIDALRKGDTVEFFGEYEWNSKGGVIHWTHHDPGGRHQDGWLRHKGVTYQ